MLMNTFAAFCAGFALNIILGSPKGILNIENLVPKFTIKTEGLLKRLYKDSAEAHRMAGVILLVLTLIVFAAIPGVLLWLLYSASPLLALVIDSFFCWTCFSVMHTRNELNRISRALASGRSDLAAKGLSMLTGTDCSDMNPDEMIKRSVEIAADCGADNAAGTLFYAAIFGGVGALVYRTVSIVRRTYAARSEKSDNFGKAANDLWCLLDFVPAHICALLASFSASVFGFETDQCFAVFKRDRRQLSAANLAPCRCVYAGALGISLTPRSTMKDGFISFNSIGDEHRISDSDDIAAAGEIMYASAFFTMLLFAAVRLIVTLIIVL
ncbi:MAG: cobalamin biosynthesis protein [Ruminococcus sp.]|nr:cobalamin biosynthesis protein [Ruminococcus sp.]